MMNGERTQKSSPNSDERHLQSQISALIKHIRAVQRKVEALSKEVQNSKQELRGLLESYGETWADEQGYARLVREGLQRSYDVEALDRLILSDPLRYGWLTDYRRERAIAEHIQVK